MTNSTIFIASDHRGYALKRQFMAWLRDNGYSPDDLGADNEERCDAMDFAVKLASAMKGTPDSRGILICGSGQAMTMAANRFPHIRAALCTDSTMSRLAREHNDANVLALGAHIVGAEVAQECLKTFLKTEFLGGRYTERRDRMSNLP